MEHGRAVGDRRLDVRHRRERLVVDVDQLGGVLRGRAALGDDHRHPVAGEPRLVGRERQVLDHRDVVGHGPEARQPAGPCVGEVGPRERCHDSGRLARGRDVDVLQDGVRIGAAHDVGVHHPGRGEVVDVAALAVEQARVLLAENGGADCGHTSAPDAARIALTMLW